MPKYLSTSERTNRDRMFYQGMLWCAACKTFKPIKEFNKNGKQKGTTNYGYRFYCIPCERLRHSTWDEKSRKQYTKDRNNKLKTKFVKLAGECCQRCGYNKFQSSLDFHHVWRVDKKCNPVKVIYSNDFERTWKELDKCCLLCANCHKAYEAGLWRAEFIKRDNRLGWTIGDELPLDDKRYEIKKPPKYRQASLPLFQMKQKPKQLALFSESA